jgi:maleate isomerase
MKKTVRIGFLVPPGNPTCEPEMMRLAPPGVTVHFNRMVASGAAGSHEGQEERNRQQLAHLEDTVALLAMVKPAVIVMGHTASSYTLGQAAEKELVERITKKSGIPFLTAFGSVLEALERLNVKRVALGAPYAYESMMKGKAYLELHGLQVPGYGVLENVSNIYDETPERAYELGRKVDTPEAQGIFLTGVGMPTIDILARLERDAGKPAISSASAMMWHALRTAGVNDRIEGYGRLLSQGD